jgi:hypothetical protein
MACSAAQITAAANAGMTYSNNYRMGMTQAQCQAIAEQIAAAPQGGDEKIVKDYCANNGISGVNVDQYASALGDAIAAGLATCRGR